MKHPCLTVLAVAALTAGTWGDEPPRLTDERLELKLFAADPDIVTPIGMAIDDRDRIFVIESHTHLPPEDYAGPESDRIKLFVDENNDGKPDRISIFADGIQEAVDVGRRVHRVGRDADRVEALGPEGSEDEAPVRVQSLEQVVARSPLDLHGPGVMEQMVVRHDRDLAVLHVLRTFRAGHDHVARIPGKHVA